MYFCAFPRFLLVTSAMVATYRQTVVPLGTTKKIGNVSNKLLVRLHRSNLIAFFLHAIWVILIVSTVLTVGAPFNINVSKIFQTINTTRLPEELKSASCNGTEYTNVFDWFDCLRTNDINLPDVSQPTFTTDPYVMIELPVWVLILVFEVFTSGFHGVLYLFRDLYEEFLIIQMQPFRWVEYSITCSLMTVILMGLSNISDIYLLLAMYTLSVFYNIYGGLFPEILNNIREVEPFKAFPNFITCAKIHALLASWFAFLLTFVLIWDKFTASIEPFFSLPNGNLWGQLYGFILILNVVLLLAFLCFPIIQLVQFTHAGDLKIYLHCEFAYIIASFVAKTILTLVIIVTAVQRGD